MAPVISALDRRDVFRQVVVHTGQHYDTEMSEVFFHQLGMPRPDVNLGVGSGSHAVQTAKVIDMLMAVPKYGRVKTNRILNQCRISPSKTIGGLSERQRAELVAQLRK